jgi:hypothetical protein
MAVMCGLHGILDATGGDRHHPVRTRRDIAYIAGPER